MTLVNGREVEIDHVSPPKGKLLYRSSNPTIFLKIHTASELFLPIIVGMVLTRFFVGSFNVSIPQASLGSVVD
jgi:hypothetical protein